MNDLPAIEEKVFEYIRKNTFSDKNAITSKTMIFREGILDSMAFVLLIDFIEETFSIKTDDKDLIEENFESIEAISHFINCKLESNMAKYDHLI